MPGVPLVGCGALPLRWTPWSTARLGSKHCPNCPPVDHWPYLWIKDVQDRGRHRIANALQAEQALVGGFYSDGTPGGLAPVVPSCLVGQPSDPLALPGPDAVNGSSGAPLNILLRVEREESQTLPGLPRCDPEKLQGLQVATTPCRISNMAWTSLVGLHVQDLIDARRAAILLRAARTTGLVSRTALEYSNVIGCERPRQAATGQRPAPATASDLAAESSHRGGQGFKSPQLTSERATYGQVTAPRTARCVSLADIAATGCH